MITFLKGTLTELIPTRAVIEVNGIGYEVLIPVSSFEQLPRPGSPATLLTHLWVRDDAQILYGFASEEERTLFRLLVNSVSRVGPKIALSILSSLSPSSFRLSVAHQDIKSLSRVPGLGRKTAERIVVELKDRFTKQAQASPQTSGVAGAGPANEADHKIQDAIAALAALGFRDQDAVKRVYAAKQRLGIQVPLDQLVKASLQDGPS